MVGSRNGGDRPCLQQARGRVKKQGRVEVASQFEVLQSVGLSTHTKSLDTMEVGTLIQRRHIRDYLLGANIRIIIEVNPLN